MMPQPALQWPLTRPGSFNDPAFDPCGAGPVKPEQDERDEGDDGPIRAAIASLTEDEAAEVAPSLRKAVAP